MKRGFLREMMAAGRRTRSGRMAETTKLLQRLLQDRFGGLSKTARAPAPPPHAAAPETAFVSASFTNAAGTRPYRLYVPRGYRGQPVPLIVMLHGCTQSPEDFALGTRMNEAAEAACCLVAYPGQTPSANGSKCWNWFRPEDQQRGSGEPALLAGIAQAVMREYAIDPKRVYVAGMSAGGAAAALLGRTYPDLFAAVGVHSGLPCGAAHDVNSAFVAMRQGPPPGPPADAPPTIVFHGDQDTTVNPSNGDAVAAQAQHETALDGRTTNGQVPGGHRYRVTRHADAAGRVIVEQWVVHGAGHAWSGGSPAGSFTDARGPDATAEMLRFFLQHQKKAVLF